MSEEPTVQEISRILALKFENIRKEKKISYVSMQEEFYEKWRCSKSTVKQYLDQTFIGGIAFREINPEKENKNNNFIGTHSKLSLIELHATLIDQIISFMEPNTTDKKDIYTLLNKINPNYFN